MPSYIVCFERKGFERNAKLLYLNRWTKTASSKPIFDVNGICLEGCSQVMHEDRLILHNWSSF